MRCLLIVIFSLLTLFACSSDNGMDQRSPPTESGVNFRIIVGSTTFKAMFYNTTAAEAFQEMLPFSITMGDFNDNEKHCTLPHSLPTSASRPSTIRNGDLMLYGANTLVLFYQTFSSSYSYTRIGRVDNPSGLRAALGRGDIVVRYETEKPAEPVEKNTLTYNINGATSGVTPAAITAETGAIITLSNNTGFNRNGYSFVGWNTNANGTGVDYPAGGDYTLNQNSTLYAKWETISNNSNVMTITIANRVFTATLANNATTRAFKAMLPLRLNMSDFNNNEKVCSLPNSLPTSASNPGRIQTGDIMLYGSSSLVLFYETFQTSYSYTKIGQVDNISDLKSVLGSGNVSITFELAD